MRVDELAAHLARWHLALPDQLPLGELLVHLGLVTPEQIHAALVQQHKHKSKRKLGSFLVEQGLLNERALVHSLYRQAQLAHKPMQKLLEKFGLLVPFLASYVHS